jgi:glycine hydroxymethyltransferase
MHVIAAKAVAFKEAQKPSFKTYQKQIVRNAKALARALSKKGFRIVSGGTDNHLMLVDLTNKGIAGRDAALALDRAGMTVNKNLIPYDTKPPAITSGIRIGTPAITTRGMKEAEMEVIADLINRTINNVSNGRTIEEVKKQVKKLTDRFPLYKALIKRVQA